MDHDTGEYAYFLSEISPPPGQAQTAANLSGDGELKKVLAF